MIVSPSSSADVRDEATIAAWLVTKLADYLGIDAQSIDVREPFAGYGLESADAIGLVGELEEWLDEELPATLAYDFPSIALLARRLATSSSGERRAPAPPAAAHDTGEPIAIIGIGCRFPGAADSPAAFWQLLRDGRDATGEVPPERWDIERYYDADPAAAGKMYTRRGAFVRDLPGFDAAFFAISPREAQRMDPQQRLLLEVSWEALEHAGLDVARLAGSRTGVFVGMMNTHEYAQLQLAAGDSSTLDDPYFGIGSASSVASGRLSYALDLQGPNVAVDTACSSALVAVHLACQSLRRGEADLALAAGAHAMVSPDSMVNACKMGMLAPDGRCKTFDAAADGFVLGEGCGVVVLKRVSDALADGDTILALIRGSAINQDGRSNGLTAPNGRAQQAVIRDALANAAVEAAQVGYLEAHGSGTALGDPIEIAAINAVFGAGRSPEQPLAVGTVKTNIGHLAGAAGIAGLIKTVLLLQHGEIPPHLNLREPSPNIPWQQIPIVVPTAAVAWSGERPRVAGVNSFGWSGTNAHVVVEAAPAEASPAMGTGRAAADPVNAGEPWQLLTVSARTETALAQVMQRLEGYVREHADADLADIAYSLQTGRAALEHRRALLCRDRQDALLALAASFEQRSPRRIAGAPLLGRPLGFVFAGVGDHYAGMGSDLYATEPVFRAAIDRCADLLLPRLGVDLRDLMFEPRTGGSEPQPAIDLRSMLGRGRQQAANGSSELHRTLYAQPLVFALDYALAQLWLSRGIVPEALIGYSLGEYVAACVAGVFSLEDAVMLVAERAALIEQLPQGAMLAVGVDEAAARALLTAELCLAAINSPSTAVIAGPEHAIVGLEHRLADGGMPYRRLPTSHAFHSSMMEPIVAQLVALFDGVELHPPAIPYLSNVTGTWIAAAEATDPRYWSRHLTRTVRFADGVAELWRAPGRVLLELGPGRSLGSFAVQQALAAGVAEPLVLASLGAAYEQGSDRAVVLGALGRLWEAGVTIDWRSGWSDEPRRRLHLPGYPWEHQRFWVSTEQSSGAQHRATPRGKRADIADWTYVPVWKQSPPLLRATQREYLAQARRWLIVADDCGVAQRLAEHLEAAGQDVVLVAAGEGFRRTPWGGYSIDMRARADYTALLKHLQLIGKQPEQIVHLRAVSRRAGALDRARLDAAQQDCFYSLLYLAQALGEQHIAAPLTVISSGLHAVSGDEELHPEKATLLGPCKVIPKEYEGIVCRSVDICLPPTASAELADLLVAELASAAHDNLVAYRGKRRWVQTFEPLRFTANDAFVPRPDAAYLITGGLGGLGLHLAGELAAAGATRLLLTGRSALPAREDRQSWIDEHAADDPLSRKLRAIAALEQAGADVLALQADVADGEQMHMAIGAARERWGRIDGVFHAAGVPGEGLIQLKTPELVERVFAPKLRGTLLLDELLADDPPDFMVLYSSSNAVTGGIGEVDYCAANAFMDAFAHWSATRRGTQVTAINWGPWQWDAWQSSIFASLPALGERIADLRRRYGIELDEGAQVLRRIMGEPQPQVLVLTQDLEATVQQWDGLTAANLLEQIAAVPENRPLYPRPNLRTPYVAPRNSVEEQLASIWQAALGVERVGIHDQFFELGGNSLIGMSVVARIERQLGIKLSAASLFEGPTIASLAELIAPPTSDAPESSLTADRGRQRRERMRRQQATRV